MKKIIRKGCFEVNSSSSHSISIGSEDNKEFVLDPIYPDQDGVIFVSGDMEFGWEHRKYNDSLTKLSYVYQSLDDTSILEKVLLEQTGAEKIVFLPKNGYIDHQSDGIFGFAQNNEEDIKDFIFNKNSWLFTANDNTHPDPTFYHVPEYKDGKMIRQKYKYELVIDNFPKTTKYLTYPSLDEISQGIESLTEDPTCYLTEDNHFIIEDDIFFQISRPRNKFYVKDWSLIQEYEKNMIYFMKEGDQRFKDIEEEVKKIEDLNWHERKELIMSRALNVPDLIKKVNFKIVEI